MCPACGAADASTRHARLCYLPGAQVNQHQPLVHTTSRFLKRMSVRHQVESGAPLTLTGTYVWKSLSRGEASEKRRHRISDTKAL